MGALFWSRPPVGRVSREEWDRWCWEMRRRNYAIKEIAKQLGVSKERVINAIKRVEGHRYDG